MDKNQILMLRRKELKLKQDQIAEALDCTKQYICFIEKNKSENCSPKIIQRYEEVLFNAEFNEDLEYALVKKFKEGYKTTAYNDFIKAKYDSKTVSYNMYLPYVVAKLAYNVQNKNVDVYNKYADILHDEMSQDLQVIVSHYKLLHLLDNQQIAEFTRYYNLCLKLYEKSDMLKFIKYVYVLYLTKSDKIHKAISEIISLKNEFKNDNEVIYFLLQILEASSWSILTNFNYSLKLSSELYDNIEKIETEDDTVEAVLLNISYTNLILKNYKIAAEFAERVLTFKESDKVHFILSECYFNLDRSDLAMMHYEKIFPQGEMKYLRKYLDFKYVSKNRRNLLVCIDSYKRNSLKRKDIENYVFSLKLKTDNETAKALIRSQAELFNFINNVE